MRKKEKRRHPAPDSKKTGQTARSGGINGKIHWFFRIIIDIFAVIGDNFAMPEVVEHLSINETNALLKSIDDLRDRAIITLFLNTGVFLNELVQLKIDSIKWETKMLAILGSRQREIPLNDQLFDSLAKYSKERPDVSNESLFLTTKGKVKSLSARSVDQIIRNYAGKAGIGHKVNAQVLRNTFAVRLFSEEISPAKASAILGITDSESINRYIQAAKNPVPENIPTHEELQHVDTRPKIVQIISKLFPTKPKPARKLSELKGPIVPNPEETVIGRASIIEDIKSNLNKEQPVLLYGPLGIGKSHILKHVSRILGPNTLYLSSPSPMRNLLTQICEKVNPEWQKQIKSRASTKELADFIVKSKGNSSLILIIDGLNNLKISDVEPFLVILENFTMLGATEEIKAKLKQVWWKFKQVELKELSDEAAKELIKYLTQNLSISDYELLETRIMTLSNKLPLAIVDMVHQVSHRPVVTRNAVREVYHEAGVTYRDWTTAIVILWGIAIIFRFIALGTHSFEGYILAGFGTAGLAVMRFFVFRMR